MDGYIDADKLYSKAGLNNKQLEIRRIALNSFEAFIRLAAPYQLLSHCHIYLTKWIQQNDEDNKLILWPRDHGKSRMAAFYSAWCVVRDPATTIIYTSATAEKAEEQLRFIKSILTSKIAFRYFPGLINVEEGKRVAWNKTFIIVDHPLRDHEGVIDSTIMTCGMEKTITGKHCRKLILDDLVVKENNTEVGRKEVNRWVADAASIMSADSAMLAIGTRYHPRDAYQIMIDMVAEIPEKKDNVISIRKEEMFKVNIADVEVDGEFLWPQQQRKDGKRFGFNPEILARKRAVYEASGEIVQFYAQYYNDPNDKSTAPISRELFKYYDKEHLEYGIGLWTIEGRPAYLFAAVDLATSLSDSSDYSVIIIGAIDDEKNRYVLDIARFRTNKISTVFNEIRDLYERFRFKKLRIEAVSGFKLVAEDLAERLYSEGVRIPVDFYIPSNRETKAVRINGILEPLYQSGAIYHYRGGNCQILEDELVSANPLNDDTKDAWAMTCDLMVAPITRINKPKTNVLQFHRRFGGVL